MRTLPFLFTIFTLLLLQACGPTSNTTSEVEQSSEQAPSESQTPESLTFAQAAEAAHAKADFRQYAAIQFDLQLFFGDRERLNGTLTLSTDSRHGLIETKEGKKTYFHDDKVFFAPDTENVAGTRFSAYTWPYFFMLPYKLSDPGTVWNDYPEKQMDSTSYLVEKLSFQPGTGDAPDDWYVVYADKSSQLLQVAAYIVTARKSQEEAEEDPHAIQYLNYQTVSGIPIATEWKFWGWQADQGLTDQLGKAKLSNISFLKETGDIFTPPAEYISG